MIIAKTERLILRRWRESDRQPFAALNADARVVEFFPRALSPDESNLFVDRIEAHHDQYGFGFCAAELIADQAFVGFIGLAVPRFSAHFTPCVEIGWRLSPKHWGRGLATEGAREIVRQALDVHSLREIVAYTVPGNLRSRRVMEKLGMTHDAADDFDHPNIPEGNPLRHHVLYRLRTRGRSTRRRIDGWVRGA
jgi:RimJ/RimL family protein N-acetyltransferase